MSSSGASWKSRNTVWSTACSASVCLSSARWLPLTYAVNSLNYSMGQPDLYPFVLAPTVMGKLRFVHGLVRRTHDCLT